MLDSLSSVTHYPFDVSLCTCNLPFPWAFSPRWSSQAALPLLQQASPPASLCLSCLVVSPSRPLTASCLSTLTFQRAFFLEAFDLVICSHLDFFTLLDAFACCVSAYIIVAPQIHCQIYLPCHFWLSVSQAHFCQTGSRMDICDFGDLNTSTFIWIGSKNVLFIKVMNKIRGNISILKMVYS